MAHVAPTTVLPATSRWLEQLGFTRPLLFTELQLFETLLARTSRCGIYVLHMVDGQYYVGQSVDVVKRLGQHRRRFEAIERISFKPVARTKAQLDLAEIEAIQTLEAAGLPASLINPHHSMI